MCGAVCGCWFLNCVPFGVVFSGCLSWTALFLKRWGSILTELCTSGFEGIFFRRFFIA